MKKVLASLLAVFMIISLFACGNTSNDKGSGQTHQSEHVEASDFGAWESVDWGKWGGDRDFIIVALFLIIASSMYILISKKKMARHIFFRVVKS